MSQPSFEKTLLSLHHAMTEVKYLRIEVEDKKLYIAELEQKIKTLESPNPKPTQTLIKQTTFKGNWNDMASTAIVSYINPKTNKNLCDQQKILAEWKRAIKGNETNENVEELWKCIIAYVETVKWNCTKGTLCKKCGNIKTITNRLLHIPNNHDFETMYESLQSRNNAEQTCKTLRGDDLAFLKCEDMSFLTTSTLVENIENIDDSTCKLLMGLYTYHGNRSEDWMINYGKQNYVKGNKGYYDNETNEVHLFSGKTQFDGERVFKLKPHVQTLILNNRKDVNSKWLLPATKAIKSRSMTTNEMCTTVKEILKQLKLPIITPTQLRHVFETNLRYVSKLSDKDLKVEWDSIAHSESTARKYYGELYKYTVMHDQNEQ